MLNLIYHADDQAAARRLIADFNAAGIATTDLTETGAQAKGDILLPIISPASTSDPERRVEAGILGALDLGLRIVPVVLGGAPLPKWIDHLTAADLTNGYDFSRVQVLYDQLAAPGAKLPLKVLTPNARKANQRIGWVLSILAIAIFLIGLYAVGVLHIQAPAEEFTNENQTQNAMIRTEIAPVLATMERFLPNNPDDAFVYPATLFVQPTRYWPYIAATATEAAATRQIYPATLTPTPSS